MRVDWCVSKEDVEEPIIIDGIEIEQGKHVIVETATENINK